MDTFTGAKPVESELGAGRGSPAGLVGAGIALIAVVGLIHMIDAPEDLEEGSYLGFLFVANFLGALVAAAGIYRGNRWGWVIGLLLAGGAFAGYVISRTAGLPGLPAEEEWLEPLGVHFLVVEALFAGIFLAVFVPPRRRAGKPALRHQKFSKEEGHDQEGIDAARDGRLDGGRGDRRCRGVYAGRDPDRNPHQGSPRACRRLGRSRYRNLFQLPTEGTDIVVLAKGLKPGKRYVSLYYDNDHCALEPYSEDDGIGGPYTALPGGFGFTIGTADNDLDEINSVSVRSANNFQLRACAPVQH